MLQPIASVRLFPFRLFQMRNTSEVSEPSSRQNFNIVPTWLKYVCYILTRVMAFRTVTFDDDDDDDDDDVTCDCYTQ